MITNKSLNDPTNVTSAVADPASAAGNSLLRQLWASVVATVVLTIIVSGLYPLAVWGVAQAVMPKQANGSLVKKDGTLTTNGKEAVGSSLLGQQFSLPGYFHPRPSAANNSPGSSYAAGGGYDPTSSGATNFGPLSDEWINGLTTSPTPPATQPAEFLAYDGVRLRTIHYALDNGIAFKLHHAVYEKDANGDYDLAVKDEVPLKTFQDSAGVLQDIALVDNFPHPTPSNISATPSEYTRTVVIADGWSKLVPADAVLASASGLDPHITPENAEVQKTRVATARNIKPEQLEELIIAHTDGRDLGFLGEPGVNVLTLNLALDAKYPLPAPAATQPSAPTIK